MPTLLERKSRRLKLPSAEQGVVDEFRGVIHRHRDESPITLARLMNVAFDLSLGPSETRESKLARAMLRGIEARQELAQAEGGSLSSEDVSRLLGISKTAVLKRLDAGRLLAWREERLQAARFPQWQFNDYGQVLPGLEDVLSILNRDERLDEWGKILFFLREASALEGRRPLDLLCQGKMKQVLQAAHAYAE